MDTMVALTTVATKDEAKRMARELVELKLAACVQIQPIESVYSWKGAIHEEPEVLLIIKTRRARLDELQQHILAAHSYDVPEFVALPTTSVSDAYERWVVDSTRKELKPTR